MEYNRMVAYIYSYNNGLKNQSSGFARMEVRNDNIRLKINMKTSCMDGYAVWKVYLFFRKFNRICGISLGEMPLRGGMGEFTYTGNAADIERSRKSFDEICGIFIMSGKDRSFIFASEWDDLGFDTEAIGFEDDREYKAAELPESEIYPADNETEDDMDMEADKEEQNYGMKDEYDKEYEEDADVRLQRMWELLSRDKEKLFIFADDELYDVVEINPDDIDKMPNTNWHLKNNSFVNHGYFNFRHLIAGKMHTGDGDAFFMGVPGIYSRRERAVAGMYGFNRFKFSMRSDMRLNQFGYWYREITD